MQWADSMVHFNIDNRFSGYYIVCGLEGMEVGNRFFNSKLNGLILALLSFRIAYGQDHTYLIGMVSDNGSKSPVSNANIIIVGSQLGTISDSAGRFTLRDPPIGWHVVKVSHVGYVAGYYFVTIEEEKTFFINAVLNPTSISLPEVTVTGTHQFDEFYRLSSSADVTAKDIKKDGIFDFEGLFLKYAYFMTFRDYALFVDGIREDPEFLKTINVRDVKEVFVWRKAMAPIEFKERLGTTWNTFDYVVLVNTR
ncbi:MAG TPA: carboxypeptidase-like regulatory domain-containing protein [Candidatus Acidoferrales bacterium]|nr:carboxypeptidase-like regulatory domain-containing protein [Candidatus Acidoferrales bacterium]